MNCRTSDSENRFQQMLHRYIILVLRTISDSIEKQMFRDEKMIYILSTHCDKKVCQ